MLTSSDNEGFLDAFGDDHKILVKGVPYRGIVDNEYTEGRFGNLRISSNAPIVKFPDADVVKMALALNDTVTITPDATGVTTAYLVKSKQPDGLGWTECQLVEVL